MIPPEKHAAAVKALHSLFVSRRNRALNRGDEAAAAFFDHAEYLPALMLEAEDRADAFERHLAEWAADDEDASRALAFYHHTLGEAGQAASPLHKDAA